MGVEVGVGHIGPQHGQENGGGHRGKLWVELSLISTISMYQCR